MLDLLDFIGFFFFFPIQFGFHNNIPGIPMPLSMTFIRFYMLLWFNLLMNLLSFFNTKLVHLTIMCFSLFNLLVTIQECLLTFILKMSLLCYSKLKF